MANGSSSRLGFVECLRLLAAVVVFVQHLAERYSGAGPSAAPFATPYSAPLAAVARLGPGLAGVMLFFLISGYVVPMSIKAVFVTPSRGRDGVTVASKAGFAAGTGAFVAASAAGAFAASSSAGAFAPGPFLVRRLFRVYPLLIVAFALVFAAGQTGLLPRWAWMAGAGPRGWAANLLLIDEYLGARAFLGVTWTLAIEFAWYGLFALAVWRWGAGAGLRLAVALPVALVLLAGCSLVLGTRIPLGRIILLYACAVGFLAFLHDTGRRDVVPADAPLLSRRALLAHVVGFIVVATACELVSFGVFAHRSISLAQVAWPTVVAPLVFVAAVLLPAVRAAPLLARGVVPAIGSASYSIYLLHPVGLALGDRFGAPYGVLAGAGISIAATGVLALLGYRLVELPGIALGRSVLGRWVLGRRGRGVAAGAAGDSPAGPDAGGMATGTVAW